jgi:hypothetical protein
VPSFRLFRRSSRRSLLIEINPFQILAAGIRRSEDGSVILDGVAEFPADDDAGFRAWLADEFDRQKSWVPAVVSLVPPGGLLQRESLQPRKLAEPGYLAELAREQYKIEQPGHWILETLNPQDGTPLPEEGIARPALVFGVAHAEVHRAQQRLLDHRLLPYQLEMGLLPLIGALADHKARRGDKRAIVVVVIHPEHTAAYILGKEGVHTPALVRHGFSSIVQAVGKEFGLASPEEARRRLQEPEEELKLRATRFVRAIGRDLKPVVDSYEMTTGQPVGEIYCAYLPPALSWLAEPLAQVVQRAPFVIDCRAWLPTVGLRPAGDLPGLGQHWLGVLSLIAIPPGPRPEKVLGEKGAGPAPWHVDCRLSAQLPSNRLIGGRFLVGALATALSTFALILALWQAYVIHSLDTDTEYWNRQTSSNQKLFDELTHATRDLQENSARFDHAYALMRAPYPVTDFVLNLGRSLPPRMRVDRIEADPGRVAMSGSLNEPPEQASRSLGRYMEGLRRSPAIGPLFSSIGLTSLQREGESDDSLAFEITFRLKGEKP